MPPVVTVLVCCGAALLVLLALWLFLIAPRARRAAVKPFLRGYAHRGLWGQGVPENSLTAFRLAAEQGFAIELDVQLSSDGEVMVFHDYTLTRMCKTEQKLADLSAADLGALKLDGTDEGIPTLREVLTVVAGRVPLLIELKGENGNVSLCPRVAAALEGYEGEWCVESFNPLLLRWFKKHRPDVVRGLLSTDLIKEKKSGSRILNFALSALLLTFLCRPQFHAWDQKYPRRAALRCGLVLFGAASFVYTVKSEQAYRAHLAKEQYPIFDGFVPAGLVGSAPVRLPK
ncbi:MAG: glycerophosphodiester phosphodiesterase [Ruminococcaceae bacterium]|nr:glycerophosphodiester phosphodiesterase [Oscillospiraceae bacterium]